MAKKRSNIIFVLLAAIFIAGFLPISKANAAENPNAHNCYQEGTSSTWICEYKNHKYKWKVNEDGSSTNKEELGECTVFPVRLSKATSCLFCPVFLHLFNAVQQLSTDSFKVLAPYLQILLAIGFALWIAFVTLPTVASLQKQDAPKYIKSVLVQSFKVGVCFLLLTFPEELYRLVVDTVLIAGFDFGSAFLFEIDTESIPLQTYESHVREGFLGKEVYAALYKFLYGVQRELGFLVAISGSLTCIGINSFEIGMMISGILVFFFMACLTFAFGFYLIDSLLQIGIVGALMPLIIATYPFKITKNYAETAFDVLMNTFFTFVIMGVIMSINVTLILEGMLINVEGTVGDTKQVIFEAFEADNIDEVNKIFDVVNSNSVFLLLLVALAFKFTIDATSIASKYGSGALISGISQNVGGMGLKGAEKIGSRVSKPVRKAGTKAAKKVGKAAVDKGKSVSKKVGSSVGNAVASSKAGQKAKALGSAVANSKLGKATKKASDKAQKFAKEAKALPGAITAKGKELKQKAKEKIQDKAQKASDKVANTKLGKGIKKGAEKIDNAAGHVRGALNLDSKHSRAKAMEEKLNKQEENEDEE